MDGNGLPLSALGLVDSHARNETRSPQALRECDQARYPYSLLGVSECRNVPPTDVPERLTKKCKSCHGIIRPTTGNPAEHGGQNIWKFVAHHLRREVKGESRFRRRPGELPEVAGRERLEEQRQSGISSVMDLPEGIRQHVFGDLPEGKPAGREDYVGLTRRPRCQLHRGASSKTLR